MIDQTISWLSQKDKKLRDHEEFIEKKKIQRFQDERDRFIFEKDCKERTIKKHEWTQLQLKKMTDDEILYFKDLALKNIIQSYPNAKKNWMIWPKHIRERAMCIIREHYHCPFTVKWF